MKPIHQSRRVLIHAISASLVFIAMDATAQTAPTAETTPPASPATPWSYEGGVGLPLDASGNVTPNGYGELGYQGVAFGFDGYVEFDSFDEGTESDFNTQTTIIVEASSTYLFGEPSDDFRFSSKLLLEFNLRNTEYAESGDEKETFFEDSNLLILGGIGGFEHKLSESLAYRVGAGVGGLQEYYDAEFKGGDTSLAQEIDPGFTLAWMAESRFFFVLWEGVMNLRHKVDVRGYSIHHLEVSFADEDSDDDDEVEAIPVDTIEYATQLALDVTAFSFLGVSPYVYSTGAGFLEEAGDESDSDLYFEFGVGIGTSGLK